MPLPTKATFYNELATVEKSCTVEKKFLFFKWKSRKTIFQLTQPLVYWSPILNAFVVVPKNFWTDYASHPIKALGFSPPYETNRGAVIHDELYSLRFYFIRQDDGKFVFLVVPKTPTWRDIFDTVLKEAIEACGLENFRAWAWFFAVRAGGKGAWTSVESSPDLDFDIKYLRTLGLPFELIEACEKAQSKLKQF